MLGLKRRDFVLDLLLLSNGQAVKRSFLLQQRKLRLVRLFRRGLDQGEFLVLRDGERLGVKIVDNADCFFKPLFDDLDLTVDGFLSRASLIAGAHVERAHLLLAGLRRFGPAADERLHPCEPALGAILDALLPRLHIGLGRAEIAGEGVADFAHCEVHGLHHGFDGVDNREQRDSHGIGGQRDQIEQALKGAALLNRLVEPLHKVCEGADDGGDRRRELAGDGDANTLEAHAQQRHLFVHPDERRGLSARQHVAGCLHGLREFVEAGGALFQ